MSDDSELCGWCGHRWDVHNHVTDECRATDPPDECPCPGWEIPT